MTAEEVFEMVGAARPPTRRERRKASGIGRSAVWRGVAAMDEQSRTRQLAAIGRWLDGEETDAP